jgi:CubicO group peptidase (beta-lactamase class C family)
MQLFFKSLLASLLALVFAVQSFGQSLDSQIDRLIQTQITGTNAPGGTFLVAVKGKPIYVKAFGQANLELQVPMQPDHVLQIGSMSKQFTAVAILMLEEEGKLDIKQPISAYIPDFPNGEHIEIRHLLSHTSGIRDFTKMKNLQQIANKQMSPKELVDFFKDEPVDFLPGEKFAYNNSGYMLLGYLIEVLSGQPYAEFVQERIFDKAGMHRSYYASDRNLIPGRADGYHFKDSIYVNKTVIDFSVPYASGALMSTVQDLLHWQNALSGNLLLKQQSLSQAFEMQYLANGGTIPYGYGWHLKEINGLQSREHGGSIFGFKSMAVYVPEKELYVVGLTNCDCISPTQLVRDIAEEVLKNFPM